MLGILAVSPAEADIVVHTVAQLVSAVNNTQSDGDLHLGSERNGVTDEALAVSGLVDDFDGQARPRGVGPDIGADEYTKTQYTVLSWLLFLF